MIRQDGRSRVDVLGFGFDSGDKMRLRKTTRWSVLAAVGAVTIGMIVPTSALAAVDAGTVGAVAPKAAVLPAGDYVVTLAKGANVAAFAAAKGLDIASARS